MKLKILALFVTLLVGTASPAMAQAAFCNGGTGVNLSFGFMIGDRYTEDDRRELALTRLRQTGVDATRVEFWNGCLRAWVRQPGGGEQMELYDPDSLLRVR